MDQTDFIELYLLTICFSYLHIYLHTHKFCFSTNLVINKINNICLKYLLTLIETECKLFYYLRDIKFLRGLETVIFCEYVNTRDGT